MYKLLLISVLSYVSFLLGFAQSYQKQTLYLSGTDNRHTKSWDFFCTAGRNSGQWTSIRVPSCWEQQGFGNYEFGRNNFTLGKNYKYMDEKGLYRYSFDVPANWADKDVFLVFEGSMTDTEVKINGQKAGATHQGAFYCFRYCVSDKLLYGKSNKLEVTVEKLSKDTSVNNAERHGDYWNFGGIFRPVYLEAFPKEHISRIAIDAQANGAFSAHVFVRNLSSAKNIQVEIADLSGKVLVQTKVQLLAKDTFANLSCKVANPKLWTSETPNLYRVNVYLKDADKVVSSLSEKFGFRTIEVRRGDGIYLNGVKIKMKGTNRHCFWPESGRTLNHDINVNDAKLIKEMNMNAVRCSHYPPDKDFLDVCDSLGLYVIDELAGWQKAYATEIGRKLVREMVEYDTNHPSIIFWSNGNEGGSNAQLDTDFAKYDPSKRTLIRAHYRPGYAINGIDCNHYEDYSSTSKIVQDSLIYMPTEFLHCQDDGGGGAGLEDMWELMWTSKRSAGGFLWALLDEGLTRTDMNGFIDTDGVNAPDGVVGPHREKEGSFFAIRQILSPVHISLKSLPENFSGKIGLENRFHFTNLNQCTFTYKLVNYAKIGDVQPGYSVLKEGSVEAPSVASGEKGELSINLPSDFKQSDALMLSAFDPFKNEIYSWTWKIKANKQLVSEFVNPKSARQVEVTDEDTTLSLKAGSIAILFSKTTGKLRKVTDDFNENKNAFTNGPVSVVGKDTLTNFKYFRDSDGYVIEASYKGTMKSVRWKLFNSGWLKLDYQYNTNGKYQYAGVSFNFPENYVLGAKWLGDGPYRVWKNRPQGVTYNVWNKAYNTSQTGFYPWFYPEFKGYFSNFTWMELNTVHGKITMATEDEGLYLRLFEFYGLSGAKPLPELPCGDLSFLDCIPGIGVKMAATFTPNAARFGKMGEPTSLNGTIWHGIWFYFGIPEVK